MSDKKLDAFYAIRDFVEDLWELFPIEKSPLALYHRLIMQVKEIDTLATEKFVNGFHRFFLLHTQNIKDGKWTAIPQDTNVYYGDSTRVYLEIQKYIYKMQKDKETLECIRQHLLTINSFIDPTDFKLQEALGRDTLGIEVGTDEGELVRNILGKVQSMSESGMNMDNPMDMIKEVWQSGTLGEMASSIKKGIESGKMNKRKLVDNLGGAIKAMATMMTDELAEQCDEETIDPEISKELEKDFLNMKLNA